MTPNSTKGTASYFPSIEAKYGRPVASWKKLICDRRNEAYGVGQMVEAGTWNGAWTCQCPGCRYASRGAEFYRLRNFCVAQR